MNLSILRNKGIQLPEIETEDGLTAKDLMDKIRSFYDRWEKHSDDFAEAEFLELLYNYPKSMCDRHMTETIKQLVTLIYLDSKPTQKKIEDQKEIKRLEKQLENRDRDFDDFNYSTVHNIENKIASLKNSDYWPGYSYDQLAIIFDLSKATIHDAIKQKKREAMELLGKPNLRAEAKALALEELKQEEKLKLLQKTSKGN